MIKSLLCFTIIFVFTVFNQNTVAQRDVLTILHFNDSHSTLSPLGPRTSSLDGTQGGMARVASIIGLTQMTEPNVLVLHAGDVSIGDLFFTQYFAAAEFQLMNSLGFEAMAVGNHEFDLTPAALLGALQASFPPGGGFPLVSANLIFDGTTPLLENYIDPYIVIQKGPVKVGIFSLLTPETNFFSQPAPIIVSDAIVEKAAEMVTTLSLLDCDVIILLSHLGVALDQIVASYVPGIDVIVSGHDHYKFETPLTIIDPLGGTTLLVQAKSNYMYAGKMKLEINAGNVQLLDYELIHLDESVPEEPTIKAAVNDLIAGIELVYGPVLSQQMGYANAFFNEEATDLFKLGAHDTPIGNLVTDAFRSTFATDIAIQPGGFTALPLWEGPLVAADVFRVNGYGFNTINGLGFQMVTFSLYGESLLGGLEFGLSEIEKSDEFLIQVSGMQYFYDGTQTPFSRLKGVLINGSPVDPMSTYSVTANEAVLQVLDLLGIPYSNVQLYEGITEFEVLTNYIISQGGFIYPKTLGRILNVGDCQSVNKIKSDGWFTSEPGAFIPDPTVSGHFNFNMNLHNINHPNSAQGVVKIKFPAANINLTGNLLECLLIEDNVITVRGEGKNTGKGKYGFLVTAVDAGNSGDLIKITIWDKLDGDKIIYDNLTMNELGGGYITIVSPEFATEDNETTSLNETTSPDDFVLEQNYPNPFNPSTTIKFSLAEKTFVTLKVYDIIGSEVATLVNEEKPSGSYEINWKAEQLPSGIYIYSIRAGNFAQTKKMVLMK